MRIRKSRCVESDGTHCYIGKFNVALNLYGVLEVTLYFSKSFSEVTAGGSAVAEAPQLLGVTMVYFLDRSSTCSLLHHNKGTDCFQDASYACHWSTCYCWLAWKRGPPMEYWVVSWEQGTEMISRRSWQMRLPGMGLLYFGRL